MRNSLVYSLATISIITVRGVASDVTVASSNTAADDRLDTTLWMTASVERDFACCQSYRLARRALQDALCDESWTAAPEQRDLRCGLRPAVILDVDETVLDNSPFHARLVREGRKFDRAGWDEWVSETSAKALPGARDFIHLAAKCGVSVFFVTNRGSHAETPTVENLNRELDITVTPDMVLCRGERPEWTGDKSTRRAFVAATHRIVLLVGDDLNDFTAVGRLPAEERNAAARKYEGFFGTKWILLPNPVYGSWERALYGHDYSRDDDEKRRLKREHLEKAAAVTPGTGTP